MVRIDGALTAWLDALSHENRGSVAKGDSDADDGLEWLDEASDQDAVDGDALPELLDPLEASDPDWFARWQEFEESLGDVDQADEG